MTAQGKECGGDRSDDLMPKATCALEETLGRRLTFIDKSEGARYLAWINQLISQNQL